MRVLNTRANHVASVVHLGERWQRHDAAPHAVGWWKGGGVAPHMGCKERGGTALLLLLGYATVYAGG